ncbi:latcripin-1 [Lentinula lateritia]|uniref:non-specific serine/threonine protein kinase n=1 Tax=Lentinula lateritia TaxID=40482 RepID=A0ABQ8VE76_9AGAR|nr:latcripin-1 [Lentinula lateritia]
MLLDHLNRWLRKIRQQVTKESNPRHVSEAQENLVRVDSVLSNINQDLLAKAALQCKAYALSLMNFESRIVELQQRSSNHHDLPTYYEHLHEIYAHLDEPDGMEGVSTMILSPSLEHQIRHHESSGHWTSAQSCWEVRLQQFPDNVDYHLGLLRCLRNLGHYDTLRTHVRGVLTRNSDWQPALASFQIESAWMVGAWEDVQNIVDSTDVATAQIAIARLLLALRSRDSTAITIALDGARMVLGGPIAAAGVNNYRRSYEAMLDLHLTHELETIYNAISSLSQQSTGINSALMRLSEILSSRLDSTLPTFRTRESVLSMRRTAFALINIPGSQVLKREIGRSWLASAKIARKAGQWQTAYSAMLQSQQNKTRYSFMESAKLVKAMGDPLHALQQLENSMQLHNLLEDEVNVVDLTNDDNEENLKKMKAKVRLARARWMNESERFDARMVLKTFTNVAILMPNWESGQYYLGQFQDECYKNLPIAERSSRGLKMNLSTIRAYAEAINLGTKYIYQTVPRLLTLWLDLGEDAKVAETDTFRLINQAVSGAIKNSPTYKWFTAFPQIVSRIGHSNPEVYKQLARLIAKVIQSYPNQALWLFAAVIKSKKRERSQRGSLILERIRNNPSLAQSSVPKLVGQSLDMTNELLELCNFHTPNIERKKLTMTRDFPRLANLGKSNLIIPLQESLTASLPPVTCSESVHQPFPSNAPTFAGFAEEIEIMHSLAKPRKITIHGSDGQTYMFLGKPKDDLRKDARLMDFNAIINKLLIANSESRRRQLHIRTYGVVTLNEECGFIQWVPHTRPVRPIIVNLYNNRHIPGWGAEMADVFTRIKGTNDGNKAADLFTKKILSLFPPVFHEWFIETFPEPTAWLASRLTYARTTAVMSMVGFILGLGDRHCENILLDENTGDLIHVDFNCLFEKGKTFETPERVPFRLTQNLVDALGVTGVEGVFRTACEVTMQLLRDNKDSLMSVLDAFVHDPLVEWEEEKMKLDRKQQHANATDAQRKNAVKPATDLRSLAKNSLKGIEKKLRGHYRPTPEKHAYEKEVSTSNLVQLLVQEATDIANLARMYPGWASWH